MKNGRTVLAVAFAIALVYVASGCAMLKPGPSDEQMLGDLLQTYKTATEEGDAETLIGLYSKNYEDRRGRSYDEVMEGIRERAPMFAERDIEISIDDAEIEIEGDTARVGPVSFETPRGARSMILITAKEEDGCWRITGRERQREE